MKECPLTTYGRWKGRGQFNSDLIKAWPMRFGSVMCANMMLEIDVGDCLPRQLTAMQWPAVFEPDHIPGMIGFANYLTNMSAYSALRSPVQALDSSSSCTG